MRVKTSLVPFGVILSAGLLLGGAAGGFDWRRTHYEVPITPVHQPEPEALRQGGHIPHPGAEGSVKVTVEPAAIEVRGRARSVRYAYSVQTEDDADVRYVVEFLDDLGNLIRTAKPASLKTQRRVARALDASTPSDLPDGIYTMRVKTVALMADDSNGVKMTSVHFEVRGGQPTPLDKGEYLRRARTATVTGGDVTYL